MGVSASTWWEGGQQEHDRASPQVSQRVPAEPNYAKWWGDLLVFCCRGLSPTPAQVFAGARLNACCAGVVPEQFPARGDPATALQHGDGSAMGTIHLTTQRACPSMTHSEMLWVSMCKWGLPKSEPGAGMIQPPWLESWAQSCWSWGLQYEMWKAGNVAPSRKHCAIC